MKSPAPFPPQISVLGIYSASAAVASYERFVRAYAEGRDPANFDAETIAMFRRFGRESELKPLTDTERSRIENEIRALPGQAAYVEVLVRNVDANFNPSDFQQPNPLVDQQQWQSAWNETYLSEDGESVLAGYPMPAIPPGPTLRIVFAIHFWHPELPLVSSYGELSCPALQPLPERLWRLVPYELPE